MSAKRPRKHNQPNLGFVSAYEGRWMAFEESWAADLWFRYLSISPSYELARKRRQDELTGREVLPPDFDTVLAVYDDLGDMRADGNEQQSKQYRFMGHFGAQANTKQLGVLRHDGPDPAPNIMEGLDAYLTKQWIVEGKPSAVIAAIPLGMSKATVMKQIEAMLDGLLPDTRKLADGSPKYQMADKRNDLRSVGRYYKAMMLKLRRPTLKNWQIGVMAKLSEAHSKDHLKRRALDPNYDPTKDRSTLKEQTSRTISRGHMIAENAARGIFPSYAKCEHAVPMDWAALHRQWCESGPARGQRNADWWQEIQAEIANGGDVNWEIWHEMRRVI